MPIGLCGGLLKRGVARRTGRLMARLGTEGGSRLLAARTTGPRPEVHMCGESCNARTRCLLGLLGKCGTRKRVHESPLLCPKPRKSTVAHYTRVNDPAWREERIMDARRLLVRLSPALVVAALTLSPAAAVHASALPRSPVDIARNLPQDDPGPRPNMFITAYNRGYHAGYRAGFNKAAVCGVSNMPNTPNTPNMAGPYAAGYESGLAAGNAAGVQWHRQICGPPKVLRQGEG